MPPRPVGSIAVRFKRAVAARWCVTAVGLAVVTVLSGSGPSGAGAIASDIPASAPAGDEHLTVQQQRALSTLVQSLIDLRDARREPEGLRAWLGREVARLRQEAGDIDRRLGQIEQEADGLRRQRERLTLHLEALQLSERLLLADVPAAAQPVAPLAAKPAAAEPVTSGKDDLPAGDKPAPPASGDPLFAEVRPILADHCLDCHGGSFRKSGLDLSTREKLLEGGDGGPGIVPFDASSSLLYQVVAHEKEPFMPHKADKLPEEMIRRIARWIDAGAGYDGELSAAPKGASDAAEGSAEPGADHWAFKPVHRPEPPEVTDAASARNPIDRFILARLEREGVAPSPEADRPTLIRRLSLDLTGLPPTPEEVSAFVNDDAPDAYDRLVDRLLASPHFGERWGRHWLDEARYADSDGYEKDNPRPNAWRYRNWVIDAVNRDLPFDRFTIEQLAGDLLEDPTLEQRIATGFHRNTLTNTEGGVDKEEYRVKAVKDRVATTGTVWMGLTVACAECHSHKYDPISQREYYQLMAFYNNADEAEIPAPLPADAAEFAAGYDQFKNKRKELAAALAAYEKDELPRRLAAWEESLPELTTEWQVLKPIAAIATNGTTLTVQPDQSLFAEKESPAKDTYVVTALTDLTGITGVRLEVLNDGRLPGGGPGRGNGNFVLADLSVTASPVDQPGITRPVKLIDASADFSQVDFAVAGAVDDDRKSGWAVAPKTNAYHQAVFAFAEPAGEPGGTLLSFELKQPYGTQHTLGRFRLSVTTAPKPLVADPVPPDIRALLNIEPDRRSGEQRKALADHFRGLDPDLGKLRNALAQHDKSDPAAKAPKAMILQAADKPRETHIHVRGDFLQPGDPVVPGTLAVLPPMHRLADSGEPTRLDLARWLVSPENPLTARVTVNKIWMHLFGRGLVATPEDFGTRGETPSHPELLDWLASEFVEQGWSRKRLIRTMVISATYRQSSHGRPELIERDPKNVLLAHQTRLRAEAEIVRDMSLSVSGLLVPTIGGPSVYPQQPAGISELTYAGAAKWPESKGDDRYRRGMYTFFRRTSPYPMLVTFDAPDANITCTRRERSNTPLQALTTLNDPVFIECAQAFALRLIGDGSADVDARIGQAFRLALAREPSAAEIDALKRLYADTRDLAARDAAAAAKLAGERLKAADPADAAATVAVARVVLNLDEFITRE